MAKEAEITINIKRPLGRKAHEMASLRCSEYVSAKCMSCAGVIHEGCTCGWVWREAIADPHLWCPRCEDKPKTRRPMWPELCDRCIQREDKCLYHNWPLRDDAPCICVGEDCLSEDRAQRDYPEYAHTWKWGQHPEEYEDICFCAECRSYD